MSNRKGFTLIELLMVIAIIMILVSIAWVASYQIRGRGRDSRRARDINQLYKALEMYHSGEQEYPLATKEDLISSCGEDDDWSELLTILKESPDALDPVNYDPYCYYYTANDASDEECNGAEIGAGIKFIIGFKAEFGAPETFGKLTGINDSDDYYCLSDRL